MEALSIPGGHILVTFTLTFQIFHHVTLQIGHVCLYGGVKGIWRYIVNVKTFVKYIQIEKLKKNA